MTASTPMITVASEGVLNLGWVRASARGRTPSAPMAKASRTPDTRVASVDPTAERPTARIMYFARAEFATCWAM